MNHQQAIEFVQRLFDVGHDKDCPEISDVFFMHSCTCGKDKRDVKLHELLQFLESACCFPNMDAYYEYWEEE